jgi:hypothetical protein
MTSKEALELATKYAPIFAQKVSDEWKVADQIAPVDFAGNIKDIVDNPQKLGKLEEDAKIAAKVYYSVCETSTHYFLIYAVYHVLDWWKRFEPDDIYNYIRDMLDEHIHDMEGALLVVTKYPEGFVDGLVTVAHNNFYLYTLPQIPKDKPGEYEEAFKKKSLRIVKFNETVDGNIWLDKVTQRVKLYIESRGHGIWGDHKRWGGGENIWYYAPTGAAGTPGTIDTNETLYTKSLQYQLEDIFAKDGLWANRFTEAVFKQKENGQWGFVYREKDGTLPGGAANPPWSWNDHNDTSPIGEIATDPARFIICYAQGWGPVSAHYIYNPYQSIY